MEFDITWEEESFLFFFFFWIKFLFRNIFKEFCWMVGGYWKLFYAFEML